jgi:hypothetical protein
MMREFILVAVLCLAAAFVADRLWLGGQVFGPLYDFINSITGR